MKTPLERIQTDLKNKINDIGVPRTEYHRGMEQAYIKLLMKVDNLVNSEKCEIIKAFSAGLNNKIEQFENEVDYYNKTYNK